MAHSGGGSLVLAGDVGATKTNLGLFLKGKGRPVPKVIETYPSSKSSNIEDIVEIFIKSHPLPVTGACLGVAGPVQNGRCKTTNLPWDISENRIKNLFGFRYVRLINDLTATAHIIPYLTRKELLVLNRAGIRAGRNIALIAPGTGLGEALLVFNKDGGHISVPSEGGHADFPSNNNTEVALWRYLRRRYGHVSIERILSGPGLFNIYSWLKDSGRYKEPKWLAEKIREMEPAKAITESVLNRRQPLCEKTLDIFVSILGAAAGNLALTGMTTGGVYIGGGIPPKILPKLQGKIFMESFTNKGRFRTLMEKIPVYVILNDKAALLGAAAAAYES
ncbi:MAG TPA: glucokinase [Desulfatiglandales bacterium]|nr:glucokinase [Desulfatiglandales bacterium]